MRLPYRNVGVVKIFNFLGFLVLVDGDGMGFRMVIRKLVDIASRVFCMS